MWIFVWLHKTKIRWQCKTLLLDMDTFIVQVKTNDFYKDIVEDVEKRSGTSSYEIKRPLPKEKIRK